MYLLQIRNFLLGPSKVIFPIDYNRNVEWCKINIRRTSWRHCLLYDSQCPIFSSYRNIFATCTYFCQTQTGIFFSTRQKVRKCSTSSCRRRLVTFWLEFRVSSKSENYFWFWNAINVYQGTFTVWHSTFFLQTETALMYDSALLFATALSELDRSQDVETTVLSCDSEQTWQHGNSLINYMKLVRQ